MPHARTQIRFQRFDPYRNGWCVVIVSQIVFEIVSYSAVMLLIVVGLAIVVNMMGIFNFAHGEFVLTGAYVHWSLVTLDVSPVLAILAAPLAVGLMGAALEMTVVRRFYTIPVAAMFGTYALGQILREAIRWATGGVYHSVPEPLTGTVEFLGAVMPAWRLVIIGCAVAMVVASVLILNRSHLGLRARAALENPQLARASGMSTSRIYTATFGLSAALAGLAGALIVPIYSLSGDLGLRFLIQSFLAVLLGGADLIAGAMAGAAAIGSLATVMPWIVSPAFSEILLVVIALTTIRMKPGGLLNRGGS